MYRLDCGDDRARTAVARSPSSLRGGTISTPVNGAKLPRLVVEKVARRFFARQIAVFSVHIGCVPPYEIVSMRSASTPLDTR